MISSHAHQGEAERYTGAAVSGGGGVRDGNSRTLPPPGGRERGLRGGMVGGTCLYPPHPQDIEAGCHNGFDIDQFASRELHVRSRPRAAVDSDVCRHRLEFAESCAVTEQRKRAFMAGDLYRSAGRSVCDLLFSRCELGQLPSHVIIAFISGPNPNQSYQLLT
jgi:hypothetical protein